MTCKIFCTHTNSVFRVVLLIPVQPGMVTAAGHVVHPQAGMQQPLANMPPPTPPHNAHLQQQPPGAGGTAGPVPQGHQPPHMPPHSTAGAPSVMTHPNQQPNNQHMHHAAAANYPQAGPPSNHQGMSVCHREFVSLFLSCQHWEWAVVFSFFMVI